MRGDHGLGRRPEGDRDLLRAYVPVVRGDIHDDGVRSDGVHAQEVAGIVVGRQDHLVAGADLQGAQGQLDREGAAAAQQRVLDVVKGTQPLLQALAVAAVVAAPGAVG